MADGPGKQESSSPLINESRIAEIRARLSAVTPIDGYTMICRYDHGGGRLYREVGGIVKPEATPTQPDNATDGINRPPRQCNCGMWHGRDLKWCVRCLRCLDCQRFHEDCPIHGGPNPEGR